MTLKYKHTILIVDDEEPIIQALQRLLRREKHEILTASSGKEALEIISSLKNGPALIISDQRMPEMTGSEFLEKAKSIFPNTIRYLLTGYSEMEAIIDAVNRGEIHRYMNKPWDDRDFIIQVRQALEQYELIIENKRLEILTKKQNRELKELNKNLEEKVEYRSREILQKNKELEANLYNAVRAFASLTEMNTPELGGHGRRVALLARDMCRELDMTKEEATYIEISALLHDIGKVGFSDRLIRHPGKGLSPEEEKIFRKHPVEGQNIVRFIKNLDHVGLLIRSHHEKYDGTGYPDKLSEDMIPIGSKIISVADAYDKMANMKIGRENIIKEYQEETGLIQNYVKEDELLPQAAISALRKNAFTFFDPDIVKAFLAAIKAKGINFKNEVPLSINELKEGLTLTRSLYTTNGRFLLPHDTVLTGEIINKLKNFHAANPVCETIFVSTE